MRFYPVEITRAVSFSETARNESYSYLDRFKGAG